MYLIVDCETNGLPRSRNSHYTTVSNWPRAVQVAWHLFDENRSPVSSASHIIRPDGWRIPSSASDIHGITTKRAKEEGREIADVLAELSSVAGAARLVVAHNADFDGNVLAAEYVRLGWRPPFVPETMVCTMKASTNYCRLPGGPYGQYKWPTLQQLHSHLGAGRITGAHDAGADAAACADCFFELVDRGVIRVRTPMWRRLLSPLGVSQSVVVSIGPGGRAGAAPVRQAQPSPADRTPAGPISTSESWTWGEAPGFDPSVHGSLHYELSHVPLRRTVMLESGRTVSDSTTPLIAGHNREVLQSDARQLQAMIDVAAQMASGFHRGFVLEGHKIPDLTQIPVPTLGALEVLARPATMELASRTKTGRIPKFPLSVSFVIDSDVLVRSDGLFVHVIGEAGPEGDSTIGHLGYLADGTLGKASVHCWRHHIRWSVDCVTQNGSLVVARIERGSANGTVTRFYDHREERVERNVPSGSSDS